MSDRVIYVRAPGELHKEVSQLAKKEGRSIGALAQDAFRRYLEPSPAIPADLLGLLQKAAEEDGRSLEEAVREALILWIQGGPDEEATPPPNGARHLLGALRGAT